MACSRGVESCEYDTVPATQEDFMAEYGYTSEDLEMGHVPPGPYVEFRGDPDTYCKEHDHEYWSCSE